MIFKYSKRFRFAPSFNYIPDAAGVLMPLVVRPTVTVEVEGPLMANVEKSNLEEKILCAVLYMIYQMGWVTLVTYIYTEYKE